MGPITGLDDVEETKKILPPPELELLLPGRPARSRLSYPDIAMNSSIIVSSELERNYLGLICASWKSDAGK
jgi:hypothetical protein